MRLERNTDLICAVSLSAAAILGVSLWIGLLTPLSWSSDICDVSHYGSTAITGLVTFLLARRSRCRLRGPQWFLLAPSLLAALLSPIYGFSLLLDAVFTPVRSLHQVVHSPNGRLEARLYKLGSGWSGGMRVNVTVSRSWLPGIIEDMGTIGWFGVRDAEASVLWEGNEAVVINFGPNPPRIPLNMFQWFPK